MSSAETFAVSSAESLSAQGWLASGFDARLAKEA